LNRIFRLYWFVLLGTLLLALPDPALANWWIVRASDKKSLVVDIQPTGKEKSVTKIGKEVYPTREEADAHRQFPQLAFGQAQQVASPKAPR
jgi:hypothetical protein